MGRLEQALGAAALAGRPGCSNLRPPYWREGICVGVPSGRKEYEISQVLLCGVSRDAGEKMFQWSEEQGWNEMETRRRAWRRRQDKAKTLGS